MPEKASGERLRTSPRPRPVARLQGRFRAGDSESGGAAMRVGCSSVCCPAPAASTGDAFAACRGRVVDFAAGFDAGGCLEGFSVGEAFFVAFFLAAPFPAFIGAAAGAARLASLSVALCRILRKSFGRELKVYHLGRCSWWLSLGFALNSRVWIGISAKVPDCRVGVRHDALTGQCSRNFEHDQATLSARAPLSPQ